jgi:hypothetical protein
MFIPQDTLGVLIHNTEVFHLQASLVESDKPFLEGLEKTLVWCILSAAQKECSKHISFW